jgi:hypothetical protein
MHGGCKSNFLQRFFLVHVTMVSGIRPMKSSIVASSPILDKEIKKQSTDINKYKSSHPKQFRQH